MLQSWPDYSDPTVGFGTVFARVKEFRSCFCKDQRGYEDLKIVYISIFSQIRSEGGGRQISMFSQIQNSPHYPRGGGVKKIMDFFHNFVTF